MILTCVCMYNLYEAPHHPPGLQVTSTINGLKQPHWNELLPPMCLGNTTNLIMGPFNWCQWVTATKDGLLQLISMWVISTYG